MLALLRLLGRMTLNLWQVMSRGWIGRVLARLVGSRPARGKQGREAGPDTAVSPWLQGGRHVRIGEDRISRGSHTVESVWETGG